MEADNDHVRTPSSSTQDTRSTTEDQDQKETMVLRRKRPLIVSSDDDDDQQDDTDDGYQTTQSTSNTQNRALPARVEFDRIILEETVRVNPFRAPHGTKKHAWKQVADNVKAKRSGGSDASMTGVYVRNRVYYLINTPKASAELEQLRRKLIEEKNNSERPVMQRSSRSSVSSSSDVLASPNTPHPVTVQQHQQRQPLVFPTTPIPGPTQPRLSLAMNHNATLAPSISSSSRTSSDHQLVEQRWRYLESRTQYLEQRTQYLEPRLAALETATTNLFALFSDHQTSVHEQLQQMNGGSET